jgi:Na+/melibiose symporter-like transporter
MTTNSSQKLSFGEKAGYSAADAAANFVFMTMVLFQTNFYTDVFGISAAAAGWILLTARLWDAFADPIVGVLADRTQTRWGKFRPWVLFTALPWCIVMILAYTTPKGWSAGAMVAYAAVTNILLMTMYSMNNMPYAALGGVMTGDVAERAKLNSFRFISVNAAQFIVGGFTLPLVAKFAAGHDRPDDHVGLGRALPGAVRDHVRHDEGTHQTSRGAEVLAETGLCRAGEKRAVGGDVSDDPVPFLHSLFPGRSAL